MILDRGVGQEVSLSKSRLFPSISSFLLLILWIVVRSLASQNQVERFPQKLSIPEYTEQVFVSEARIMYQVERTRHERPTWKALWCSTPILPLTVTPRVSESYEVSAWD